MTGFSRYLGDHWHGRRSLAWAFWVNLVLLRAAIFGLERLARVPFLDNPLALIAFTLAFFAVFHVVVLTWQVVGVVRACDAYQSNFGASGLLLISYLGIAAAAVLTLVSTFGAFQLMLREPEGEPEYLAWERERAGRYQLVVDGSDATLLRFTGSLELGVIRKLMALLEQHSAIRGIVLDSPGGHIYEGRGVAKLVQRHGLDTFVFGKCSSACTTVFIAGRERVLGPQGRLGFHQYWMAADYPVYLVDEEAEMQKDLDFYTTQGLAPDFLKKVFVTPHDGLWFPGPEELLAAGVVHRIGGISGVGE